MLDMRDVITVSGLLEAVQFLQTSFGDMTMNEAIARAKDCGDPDVHEALIPLYELGIA